MNHEEWVEKYSAAADKIIAECEAKGKDIFETFLEARAKFREAFKNDKDALS